MDKQSKALINEIYRLVGATAMQVEKIRADLKTHDSNVECGLAEMHTDMLNEFRLAAEAKEVAGAKEPQTPQLRELFMEYLSLPLDERLYLFSFAQRAEKFPIILGEYGQAHSLGKFCTKSLLALLAKLPQECIM